MNEEQIRRIKELPPWKPHDDETYVRWVSGVIRRHMDNSKEGGG